MNQSEFKVFQTLEQYLATEYTTFRIMAQVSFGEILSPANRDDRAFRAINAKRVDMLVIDGRGMPVAVVEYQGEGHYQNNAQARDAIKREACRSAGLPFVEITPKDTAANIIAAFERALSHRNQRAA